MSSGINKITAERNQRALLELVAKPGNDVCADCKNRNPRWASHNLGIFICMHCAAVHRKMGTHISKVKSLTMDTWSKEQVEIMRQTGNVKSNSYYNPDETRHRPPTNMVEAERDSELEKYIRSKYEYKRFLDRSAQVAAQLGPSRTVPAKQPPARSQTVPVPHSSFTSSSLASPPMPSSYQPSRSPVNNVASSIPTTSGLASQAMRSTSYPIPPASQLQPPSQTQPQIQKPSSNPVWDDLVSLQTPSSASSLPLQYASPSPPSIQQQPFVMPNGSPSLNMAPNPFNGYTINPGSSLGMSQMPYGAMTGSPVGNTGLSPNMGMGGANFGNGGMSTNPFQAQLQQQTGFTGPSMANSTTLHNPFPTQPPYEPQSQYQNAYQPSYQTSNGLSQFVHPQPQRSQTLMSQNQPHPQFSTTPSPMPFGTSLQYQQPQQQTFAPGTGGAPNPFGSWGAGQPGSFAGGQWGTM